MYFYPWIYMQSWIGSNLAEKSRNQVIHTVVFSVFDTGGVKDIKLGMSGLYKKKHF